MRNDITSDDGITLDDGSGEFPALARVGYNWHGEALCEVPEALAEWRAVAHDPNAVKYYDDDREAMDTTNWDAMLASVRAELADDIPSVWWPRGGDIAGIDDALEVGACFFGRVLALAPNASDALDAARAAAASLANYPLLDEGAYSQLEYDAWCEYAPQAFGDELRDAERAERYDEATIETLDDHAAELWPMLAEHLHYYYGFSGEYGPAFLDIFDALADDARAAFRWITFYVESVFALRLFYTA